MHAVAGQSDTHKNRIHLNSIGSKKSPFKTGFFLNGVPKGIRTPVAAVKGRCPRPTRRWGLKLSAPVDRAFCPSSQEAG